MMIIRAELSNKTMYDNAKLLADFLPEDPIFICIGSSNVGFDSFGPMIGSMLRDMGYKVYGTMEDPINGLTIYSKIKMIMNELKIEDLTSDKRIIAIDACSTFIDEAMYKLTLANRPIYPGSGCGKNIPRIGNKSIIIPTISKCINPISRISDIRGNESDKLKSKELAQHLFTLFHIMESDKCEC